MYVSYFIFFDGVIFAQLLQIVSLINQMKLHQILFFFVIYKDKHV